MRKQRVEQIKYKEIIFSSRENIDAKCALNGNEKKKTQLVWEPNWNQMENEFLGKDQIKLFPLALLSRADPTVTLPSVGMW